MQRVLRRGDRDGHDRRVQHHHQLRDAEQGQDRPSIRFAIRRGHGHQMGRTPIGAAAIDLSHPRTVTPQTRRRISKRLLEAISNI
jgi:hypothetical protein